MLISIKFEKSYAKKYRKEIPSKKKMGMVSPYDPMPWENNYR